jgi:intracellular sulfur oxidation DsrE/DsrF family protein
VELVVHGAGLPLLIRKETAFADELTDLKQTYGAHFTACSNTMKTMKVTREDLIGEVGDTVPAMVRLMERQEQGWAYIKP